MRFINAVLLPEPIGALSINLDLSSFYANKTMICIPYNEACVANNKYIVSLLPNY